MERQYAHCPECDDHMEAEYRRGRWHCENCGHDLTAAVERNMKRYAEFQKQQNRKRR